MHSVDGHVAWGARTLAGADAATREWKSISVRRLALFLEERVCRGLQWAVFEPNAEAQWLQIRLSINLFMHDLFLRGAFQGATPREAFCVQCGNEATTLNDIDLGVVNVIVGFAPLRLGEFVNVKIQQWARGPEVTQRSVPWRSSP